MGTTAPEIGHNVLQTVAALTSDAGQREKVVLDCLCHAGKIRQVKRRSSNEKNCCETPATNESSADDNDDDASERAPMPS